MNQKSDDSKHDYMVKVLVIGDSGVGKTNLITRFSANFFKESYVATIGVDFKIKTITVDDKKIKMQVWDTAGQQRFKNITQVYYKGAAGIILAFSIADAQSFQNIQKWMNQIQNSAPKDVSKVLVGTKCDLNSERTVSIECATHLAQKYSIPYFQVSAKEGINVQQAFLSLGKLIKVKCQSLDNTCSMKGIRNLNVENTSLERRKCSC